MKAFFQHLFLPHYTNNQRPKILHYTSILYFIIFFLIGSLFLSQVKKSFSQVLGTSINIAVQDLLQITNQKRQEEGEVPLVLNEQLSHAADLKAKNMFLENYWAHDSPRGETPWDFIKEAGYDYVYAGENLARGFTSAKDVVDAWMASPTHKENMLSSNYKDIGFALEEGNLTGEKDTILVVEMFGNKTLASSSVSHKKETLNAAVPENLTPSLFSAIRNSPLIDAPSLGKNITILLLLLFISVLSIDLIIIKRKNIIRIVGHNIDHIMFLSVVLIVILLLKKGVIF